MTRSPWTWTTLSLLGVAAALGGAPDARAQLEKCYVCEWNSLTERLDCEEDTVPDFSRKLCEVSCTITGEFERCVCQTSGDTCGFFDPTASALTPSEQREAVDRSLRGVGVYRLTRPLVTRAGERFGPLVAALLSKGLRPGRTSGLVSESHRVEGGDSTVRLVAWEAWVEVVGEDAIFSFEMPEDPELRSLSGQIWSRGSSAFLSLERADGVTDADFVGE